MTSVTVQNPVEREAMRYLEDQAYSAMLGYKEPIRTAEIIGEIGNEKYSTKLLRHVLAASPRFAQIDRRWDLEVRYEDKQRPLERILNDVIYQYGRPMQVAQIANELSSVYERDGAYYEPVVTRLLGDQDRFFVLSSGLFGLRNWLVDPEFDDEQDFIFYNEVNEDEVRSVEGPAAKVDWTSNDVVKMVEKFVDAAGTPVSNKTICFYRWRALGDASDPVGTFDRLFASNLVWLSDGRWASTKMVKEYDKLLDALADQLAEEIMEEAPASVVERAEVAEEVAPTLSLNISERDLDEVVQIVSAKGEARMPQILESIFEISPRDPIYAVAAEGLGDAMRVDPRFVWVGSERWRMADTIPGYVSVIPSEFEIPKLQFETADGEQLEIELEDEGLEGGLDVEIHNPLVQDIFDQDPITEQDKLPKDESARCVLKRHHKSQGTFPLCQIPHTFFPAGPHLVQVTLTDGEKRGDVWVNRETGLVYDMGQWYSEDMPDSGALFNLVRTEKQDEFKIEFAGKHDPLLYVAPARVEELLALAEEAKKRELSTLDIMTEIMADHRKGVSVITLHAEVNIVRRTTRRLVASILSSYYTFYQRPKTSAWQFDEKKVDQGFKKAKRKYVRKG